MVSAPLLQGSAKQKKICVCLRFCRYNQPIHVSQRRGDYLFRNEGVVHGERIGPAHTGSARDIDGAATALVECLGYSMGVRTRLPGAAVVSMLIDEINLHLRRLFRLVRR